MLRWLIRCMNRAYYICHCAWRNGSHSSRGMPEFSSGMTDIYSICCGTPTQSGKRNQRSVIRPFNIDQPGPSGARLIRRGDIDTVHRRPCMPRAIEGGLNWGGPPQSPGKWSGSTLMRRTPGDRGAGAASARPVRIRPISRKEVVPRRCAFGTEITYDIMRYWIGKSRMLAGKKTWMFIIVQPASQQLLASRYINYRILFYNGSRLPLVASSVAFEGKKYTFRTLLEPYRAIK